MTRVMPSVLMRIESHRVTIPLIAPFDDQLYVVLLVKCNTACVGRIVAVAVGIDIDKATHSSVAVAVHSGSSRIGAAAVRADAIGDCHVAVRWFACAWS
jgi:hypothetical protein